MSVNLSGARPQQGLVASIPGQRAPLAAESVPLTGVRIDVSRVASRPPSPSPSAT